MSESANSRYFTKTEKAQISDLFTHKLHQFCLKHVQIDMTKKSLSEDEIKRLANCYTKAFKSLDIIVSNWTATVSELSDSIHIN